MIRFTIPGAPVGKERPRTVKGHTYTPQRTKEYESLVRACALKAMEAQSPSHIAKRWGITNAPLPYGPLNVTLVWAKQIPKSWSKKRRAEALAGVWAVGVPDLDNVAKSITDSLNRLVYADDAQIAKLTVSRIYVEAESSVTVEIEELKGESDG